MRQSKQKPEREIKLYGYGNKLYIEIKGDVLVTELEDIHVANVRQWKKKDINEVALQIRLLAKKHRYLKEIPKNVKAALSALSL